MKGSRKTKKKNCELNEIRTTEGLVGSMENTAAVAFKNGRDTSFFLPFKLCISKRGPVRDTRGCRKSRQVYPYPILGTPEGIGEGTGLSIGIRARLKPGRTPPRNARQAQPTTTAQRAARRAARAASQATSDNGSHAGDGVEENQVNGPAQGQGQAALDAAAVEELRRYREAYGGRLPGEGAAGGGLAPPLALRSDLARLQPPRTTGPFAHLAPSAGRCTTASARDQDASNADNWGISSGIARSSMMGQSPRHPISRVSCVDVTGMRPGTIVTGPKQGQGLHCRHHRRRSQQPYRECSLQGTTRELRP
ncbi:hypothetical protein IGI04_040463 [Brassica rapa subsp. trilocularis]|uniref:Uncharacterized protein n=1 Tax=Brassica rapa subsp. trilocularis TaxID=1813537 RepID=A0ABQ7KPJ8_BRACM|nr:hypothetical protein IGI04_040463 [Brassica rapa subsp. trilocularis]